MRCVHLYRLVWSGILDQMWIVPQTESASSIAIYRLFLWHFCSVGIASSAVVVAVGFCEADWLGWHFGAQGLGLACRCVSRSTQLAAEDMLSCFG